MNVPFSVQLDLDATTASLIDVLGSPLEGYAGVETIRQIGDVPHVSLGVYDDLPVEMFAKDLATFAHTLSPLTFRLANIGIFAGVSSILFVGLVVTEELLAVHRRFHQALSTFGETCWEHYRPGTWVPHVTLAMNLSPRVIPGCVDELVARWKPMDATSAAVRLIRFRPVETIYVHSLLAKA